jgi:hypothetical protein
LRRQGSRRRPGATVRLCEGRVTAPEPLFGWGKVASPLRSHSSAEEGSAAKRRPSLRKERLRRRPGATPSGQESRVAAIEPVFRVWKAPSSPRSEALPAESRNMRAVGPMSVPVKACPFAYCLVSFSVAPAKPFALQHF